MPLEERLTEEIPAEDASQQTELELTTNPDTQELHIKIKSPALRAYFEREAVERAVMPGVGQIFVPRRLPNIPGAVFDAPNGPLLLDTGEINMTALRAVTLHEGITLVERGLPLTVDYVRTIRDAIQIVLRIFYAEHLRPIKMNSVILFRNY